MLTDFGLGVCLETVNFETLKAELDRLAKEHARAITGKFKSSAKSNKGYLDQFLKVYGVSHFFF